MALSSFPLWIFGVRTLDRLGMKPVLTAGLLLFAVVYFLFGWMNNTAMLVLAFLLYAAYAAATEGIAKVWISYLAGVQHRATALGLFASGQSICSLLASSLTGLVWTLFNSSVPFYLTEAATAGVVIYLWLFVPES